MLNIAVCDDNNIHLDYTMRFTEEQLKQYSHALDGFGSGGALLKSMQFGDYLPDIAILDIELGDMDGIELAAKLNELAPQCRIIFLTGHLSFAIDVYSVRHVYFVVKDRLEQYLPAALEKALRSLSLKSLEILSITAKAAGRIEVIPACEVQYFEHYNRRTRIVKTKGEFVTSTDPRELIKGECEKFFVRCHQSFWVNLSFISGVKNNEFELRGGDKVPIGRVFRDAAREAFFTYIKEDV